MFFYSTAQILIYVLLLLYTSTVLHIMYDVTVKLFYWLCTVTSYVTGTLVNVYYDNVYSTECVL